MRTVHEVCRLTGVSVRTLHYYDKIGLLKPSAITDAGYRLYDDDSLERLGQIMLFKELEFSLKDIKRMLSSPTFEKDAALEQQIELLRLRKEHVEKLIEHAKSLREKGENKVDFDAFDTKKIEQYKEEAKKRWGDTAAYREFENRTSTYSKDEMESAGAGLMELFVQFGRLKDKSPGDCAAQEQVKKLQSYITENYYTCTDQILAGLGQMYAGGGEMTENIDKAGGEGTAQFVSKAISAYCKQ